MEQHAFAPRKRLLAWFKDGWRIVPGYVYEPGDWAILLYMPTYPKPAPEDLMQAWVRRFEAEPRPVLSNHTAANRSTALRWLEAV